MSSRDERAVRHDPEPTDELLLAQSLETCLRAERVLPGSSEPIVARVPDPARVELTKLLETARMVEAAAASATPSSEFKSAARARLMRRITTGCVDEPSQPIVLASIAGRARGSGRRRWLLRGLCGLAAAGLTAAATLTASASALPGEPLYGVKQAKEEVAVRLAPDDQARALALVERANARLDETTRLLQQGRTEAAVETAVRYDESVDRATSTLVTALGPQPGVSPAAEKFAVVLAEQQVQIENVLPEAPPEAQAELREALETTERGRALAVNPAPVKQALAQPVLPTREAPIVVAPQPLAEERPTQAPTFTPIPPTAVVVHEPEPEPEVVARVEEAHDDHGADRSGRDNGEVPGSRGGGDQRGGPQPGPRQVTTPPNSGRPAVQPARPNVSGPGPSDEQRGGDDGAGDRGGNVDQRGGPPSAAGDQHGPVSAGDDQHSAPSGGDDQRATPNGGEDQRRGDGDQQPQQQPQAPRQSAVQPATQVARGQDGGDGPRGNAQNSSGGQSGAAANQSGSGDASSTARATTAPVVPPTVGRGSGGDGGGDQAARRTGGGDDQAAARPTVQQPTVQQQQQQPTRAPTATPTHQQNQPAQQTQAPQQTQKPAQQNNTNNRGSATTTTAPNSSSSGGRSASGDGGSRGSGGR